jgi:Zn-finger nucleic acid-binding protein
MRKCPRCQDKKMVPYALEKLGIAGLEGIKTVVKGLVVDQCPGCRGLFFDSHGAEILAGDSKKLLLEGAELVGETCRSCGEENLPGATVCVSCEARLALSCPGCQGDMRLARILRVDIDVCQECDALWFDDGELDKVIRRYRRRVERKQKNEPEPTPKPAPAPSVPSTPAEQKPLPTFKCIKCGKDGLRPRDVYKTPEGRICRDCMSGKSTSDNAGLSVGMMNEPGVVSGVVDAMVTLTVVDAILDLFGKD